MAVPTRVLRKKFKRIYQEEFDDPNESFLDFMLDLIPKEKLVYVLKQGKNYYTSLFYRYK